MAAKKRLDESSEREIGMAAIQNCAPLAGTEKSFSELLVRGLLRCAFNNSLERDEVVLLCVFSTIRLAARFDSSHLFEFSSKISLDKELSSLSALVLQRAHAILDSVHETSIVSWLSFARNQPDRLLDWRHLLQDALLSVVPENDQIHYLQGMVANETTNLSHSDPRALYLALQLAQKVPPTPSTFIFGRYFETQFRLQLLRMEQDSKRHIGMMAGMDGFDDRMFNSGRGGDSLLKIHQYAFSMREQLCRSARNSSCEADCVHHAWTAECFFMLGSMTSANKHLFSVDSDNDSIMDELPYLRMALFHFRHALKGFVSLHGRKHWSSINCAYGMGRVLSFLGERDKCLRLLSSFIFFTTRSDELDAGLDTFSPSSFQTAQSHHSINFLPEKWFSQSYAHFFKGGPAPCSRNTGIAYSVAMCLWLSAVLVAEDRDEASRQKALSFLHAASVSLQKDVIDYRHSQDKDYIRSCTNLIFVIEEEAKGMLQPLRKVITSRTSRRKKHHNRRNRR